MIKKQGNKFVVTNKAGTKVLGTHASKEKAQKQLAAIEISKAKHMHENKTFKAFRSTLNESEYSEVLTGYGNRSAHKDGAGLHHLHSAGALAGINAMLATIGKGTYLDPNEAFLKMKVRLNVVQLDFDWKPRSWDGGVGSYVIPVVQFGRVDGYDALTGQIRFDGKANPTGGYTELNLHVDVELTPESLYVVTAKLSPAATVAEEVEVAEAKKGSGLMTDIHNPKGKAVLNKSGKVLKYYGKERSAIKHATTGKAVKEEVDVNEDLQTPAREREMKRKIDKADDAAQRAYQRRMTKTGTVASRASKQEDKHERRLVSLLKRDDKEYSSPRTYGRGGKLVKRGSRAEVKEEAEQIEETWKSLKKTKANLAAIRASGKRVITQHGEGDTIYKVLPAKHSVKPVKEDMEQIDELNKKTLGSYMIKASSDLARKTSDVDMDDEYGLDTNKARVERKRKKISQRKMGIGRAVRRLTAEAHIGKSGFPTQDERTFIDEAGAAKLARMGYAYDRARIGSRGVNNPERKQQMRDAYYKQREKVEANKAKRVAAGTFDKGRELQAHHKRLDVIAAKRAVGKAGKDQVRVAEAAEQIDELSKATRNAYVAKRGSQLSSMMYGSGKHYASLTGRQQKNAVRGIKRATGVKEEIELDEARKSKGKNISKIKINQTFGAPSVSEALVGGQKKLDKNKNKRLDAQDFAILRGEKKAVHEAKIKKTILTQKIKDGKKIGMPRPIPRYEG